VTFDKNAIYTTVSYRARDLYNENECRSVEFLVDLATRKRIYTDFRTVETKSFVSPTSFFNVRTRPQGELTNIFDSRSISIRSVHPSPSSCDLHVVRVIDGKTGSSHLCNRFPCNNRVQVTGVDGEIDGTSPENEREPLLRDRRFIF